MSRDFYWQVAGCYFILHKEYDIGLMFCWYILLTHVNHMTITTIEQI